MLRNKLSLLVLFATLLSLSVKAQFYSTNQIKLAERLHSLAKNAPPELAYIQTSKDIYETGEDLWFKVYLLNSQYLTPSDLSQTLYLQLINETSKKSVWQEKYEIQNGFANGRVFLDSNLPEGDYVLEAFTANSFFRDTAEFYAVRKIKVVTDITSGNGSITTPVPVKSNSIQFTAFPEGGNLVSGIQNRLAFKAVNTNGEPVDIRGNLFEDNTPIMEFKSAHAGMGSFEFIPSIDKKYIIRLSDPSIDSSFFLPEIHSTGMSLQLIERNEESLSFLVSGSPGLKQEDIYLRVQCRGEVYGMTVATLDSELMIKVPLKGLPQGIAEVTLFNSDMVPVAERLVYVNQNRKLKISTELSKEIFPTRGKVILKISVKDEDDLPVSANLGVSVFDNLYENPRDSNSILSHYYLSTQLRGRIYNPSFYFNSSSMDREVALDLLMLTQGWRKYVWNEITLRKSEEHEQVISDEIYGVIYYPHRHNKVPRKNVFVMAFSPNRDSLNLLIPADSLGEFTVSAALLKRWETDYVYLKPLGPQGSQFTLHSYDPLALPEFMLGIRLTDPFEIINTNMKSNEIIIPLPGLKLENKNESVSSVSESGFVHIKEVTIKGRKQNILRGKYMGVLNSLASRDDYVCPYGVLNCLRHPPDEPPPIIREPNGYGEKKPKPGKEYHIIYNYNTPGERIGNIVYRVNRYSEEDLLKKYNFSRVKAYYGSREFYKPNYDKETEDTIVPDYRNTLLWEPEVITDKNGEATLSFFCSDINTDFVGRIEGVSNEGLLGTGNFKFSVRKLNITP
jgi:hypothetical protein